MGTLLAILSFGVSVICARRSLRSYGCGPIARWYGFLVALIPVLGPFLWRSRLSSGWSQGENLAYQR